MHSLRNRLIAAFLIATILPLAATIAITTSLLERSLGYATTTELDGLSRTLEETVRQFYQRERETLRQDAAMGRTTPTAYPVANLAAWPDEIRGFWDSTEPERFGVSGPEGDRLEFLRRSDRGVEVYTRDLAGIHMQELSTKLRQAREVVGSIEARDLRRGFTLTLLLLVAIVWLVSLAPLLFMAHRISKPIRQLTAGLTGFAEGDWDRRGESSRGDEVGRAVEAFNHMAEQLRRSRERLVYLTQMSSWQSLARKTAHELKNSLTPIRLTVEEMLARQPQSDRAFMQEAAQIVISEIETLERRVRAFSEFAREPNSGLIVVVGTVVTIQRDLIVKLASQYRLPTIYPYRFHVESGGLMSYGPNLVEGYRRAASYVDRILKGEKPADLPVQAPTRYELTINLKHPRSRSDTQKVRGAFGAGSPS